MEKAQSHFANRASKYNSSSNWVDDANLIEMIYDLSEVNEKSTVLDVATGTGLIAKEFLGKVKWITGIDISTEMTGFAEGCMDEIIFTPVEKMPFPDNTFDACVCRQGLQFADLDKAISEIYRVLKPGGITVLCHLTAYNETDRETTFKIQSLRNPARRNYFMPDDVSNALTKAGFKDVSNSGYITDESVNKWIDNGAISAEQMESIRETYRNSGAEFRRIHNIRFEGNDIMDEMLMMIAKAHK